MTDRWPELRDPGTPCPGPPSSRPPRTAPRLAAAMDPVPDVSDPRITLDLDGELGIVSACPTLEPGDILVTGSPSGFAEMHGRRRLRPGDHIRAEIALAGVFEATLADDRS